MIALVHTCCDVVSAVAGVGALFFAFMAWRDANRKSTSTPVEEAASHDSKS